MVILCAVNVESQTDLIHVEIYYHFIKFTLLIYYYFFYHFITLFKFFFFIVISELITNHHHPTPFSLLLLSPSSNHHQLPFTSPLTATLTALFAGLQFQFLISAFASKLPCFFFLDNLL